MGEALGLLASRGVYGRDGWGLEFAGLELLLQHAMFVLVLGYATAGSFRLSFYQSNFQRTVADTICFCGRTGP